MIFIGSIYPQYIMDIIIKEGTHIDFAANTFQSAIVEGLSAKYKKLQIITVPCTTTYPVSHKLLYKPNKSNLKMATDVSMFFVGFINLPIIKLISTYFQVRKTLKSMIGINETVYIYALHSPFLLAVYSLRKYIKKVCVIVPDLPDYMSCDKGLVHRILKNINKKLINKCLLKFDYFVLLSRFMESKLPIREKKITIVEGIYSISELPIVQKKTLKAILYTGIINERYGLFDLINAFKKIEGNDYKLWLAGSCSEEDRKKLYKCINSDSRISYYGILKKEEVYTLQQKATILVNPRHSNEEFTKYSFPSKTMEYLASGTPTLMCRLPAIPKEYDKHLFYFNDESIDGFTCRIKEICDMDANYLKKHGEKARSFILKEKNCYIQAKRIFDMVES